MANEKTTNEFAEKVKKMCLFEKMLNIENEVSTIIKDKVVGGQYKAAQESAILAAVKYQEVRFRVFSYPYMREVIETSMKGADHKENFIRIKVTYRFCNVDNTGEFIDVVSYGDGVDTNDKAPGKAMTYADKYALMKAYKLITGDDPDQWASYDGEKDANEPVAPKAPAPVVNQISTAPAEHDPQPYSIDTLEGIDRMEIDVDRLAKTLGKDVADLTEADLSNAYKSKLNAFNDKCRELSLNVEKYATGIKKSVSELTASDYQDAISKKQAFINSRKTLDAKKADAAAAAAAVAEDK